MLLAFASDYSGFAILIIVVVGLAIYFLPSIVAHDNRNSSTVLLVNLFFGWTLLGWVIALILAFTDSGAPVTVVNSKPDKYDQLEKLKKLQEQGAIDSEEYVREKDKILKS